MEMLFRKEDRVYLVGLIVVLRIVLVHMGVYTFLPGIGTPYFIGSMDYYMWLTISAAIFLFFSWLNTSQELPSFWFRFIKFVGFLIFAIVGTFLGPR